MNVDLTTRVIITAAGGPEVLKVEQVPIPVPGEGQVLVRMEAAGVAFGDVQLRQGRLPGKLPAVPGYDVVGRVSALGPDVRNVEVGERVAALTMTGGYATDVLAPAERVVTVPDHLDAGQVSAIVLNYLTAWRMLHRVTRVPVGGSILVLGAAGGVGSALTELAQLENLHVFGTSSAHRRAALEATGVTFVADQDDLPSQVDVTFDSVGGPSLKRSRHATRRSGTVVSYGMSFATASDLSKFGGLRRHVCALTKSKLTPGPKVVMSLVAGRRTPPVELRSDLSHLIDLLASDRIHPVVTKMPLTAAADAHRKLEGRTVLGKLVLIPHEPDLTSRS